MAHKVIYPQAAKPQAKERPASSKTGQSSGRRQGKLKLSERHIAVLATIAQHGGGPVSTAQLAALHWPPDLAKMLAWWGLDPLTVQTLMREYPAAYLGQRVELGKFLYKLQATAPQELTRLHPFCQQVQTMPQGDWLQHAITREFEVPEIFTNEIRHPSAFVSSAAKEGLRYLADAQLITADEMPVRRRSGSGQYLWYLTAKGRRQLAEEQGLEVKQVAYRRPEALSDFKIIHHLQCVDLAISIKLSCQRLGYRIIQELTDEQLKILMEPHPVTYRMRRDPKNSSSMEEQRGVTVPDYFFLIEANGKYFAHLVEVDRGKMTVHSRTPGLRDFKRRVLILSELYKQRVYHRLFPQAGHSFRYLVITNGGVDARGVHNRSQSLKTVAEEAVGEVSGHGRAGRQACRRYLVTHWSKVRPNVTDLFSSETILDSKCWLVAGDDELQALIW
jgi:hypothetical protein